MREFSQSLDKIFSGLLNDEQDIKYEIRLSECHNLVPLGKSYRIHSRVLDLNQNLGVDGEGRFVFDVWEDESGDVWTGDSDTFEDH